MYPLQRWQTAICRCYVILFHVLFFVSSSRNDLQEPSDEALTVELHQHPHFEVCWPSSYYGWLLPCYSLQGHLRPVMAEHYSRILSFCGEVYLIDCHLSPSVCVCVCVCVVCICVCVCVCVVLVFSYFLSCHVNTDHRDIFL